MAQADFPISVVDAALLTDLCASKGEARRHINAGALKLNDVKVGAPEDLISDNDLKDGVAKISVGKKKHALVRRV